MTFPDDQVAELKRICPGVQQCAEGGCTYLFLPALPLPDGAVPAKVDALLRPTPRDGYQSRLFFAERVTPKSGATLNWIADRVRIADRNWHAFSWKVAAEPRLLGMVAAHLRALK